MAAIKDITRTKKYKALIAVGLSPDDAARRYREIVEGAVTPEPDPLAALVDAGFTEEEARAIVSSGAVVEAPVAEAPKPKTSQEVAEALVEEHGYAFTKGRVYVTADTIEAAVRVRKTGSPEVVTSSGVGRTAATLIFKLESGDVAIQNLAKPSA